MPQSFRDELRQMLRRSRPPVALLTFVEVDDPAERQRLEALHGTVWNSQEFGAKFQVLFGGQHRCAVREWRTENVSLIEFTGYPRFYFNYKEG